MGKHTKRVQPILVSFKQNEAWIMDYAREHNSPGSWIKDLIVKEYKREKNGVSEECSPFAVNSNKTDSLFG